MRKQLKHNGKSRNLKLGFSIPDNNDVKITDLNGEEYPFIPMGSNQVHFTGDIPGGDLFVDYNERPPVIQPMPITRVDFSFISHQDVEQINALAQKLNIEKDFVTRQSIDTAKLAQAIEDLQVRITEENNANVAAIKEQMEKLYRYVTDVQANEKARDDNIQEAILNMAALAEQALAGHVMAINPHNITKETIGLGFVDNTADLDKPVSNATLNALETKSDKLEVERLKKDFDKANKKFEKLYKGMSNMSQITGGMAQLSLPVGGTAGQILAKQSNKDGDVIWKDETGGGAPYYDPVHERMVWENMPLPTYDPIHERIIF